MYFLVLILALFFLSTILIMFTTIEIHIKNLKFSTNKNQGKYLDKDSQIFAKINIFDKINVLKLDLTKIGKQKEKMEFLQKKIKNGKNKFDIKILKSLKYSEIKNFKLKVQIGTKDALINAILVGVVSTIISISLRKAIEESVENFWEVMPVYQNKNIIEIEFDGIFKVKVFNIIKELTKEKEFVRTRYK